MKALHVMEPLGQDRAEQLWVTLPPDCVRQGAGSGSGGGQQRDAAFGARARTAGRPIPTLLGIGHWGRLVPVGNVVALAGAMHDALAAAVDREALKRRAADFSPEIAVRRYLDLLGLA
jgi:hypothetical protein